MSLKYHRVKQADEKLPAPLRWLTRAFSSITLAVVLLTLIALYGLFASVPLGFIGKGAIYGLIGVATLGVGVGLAILLLGGKFGLATVNLTVRVIVAMACVGVAAVVMFFACAAVSAEISNAGWFLRNRAMVVYRLPAFEMTELQFYSWWPMKLLLATFVMNLIWATVRRIEFRLPYVGVLTVHAGIITLSVASIFYGQAKVEGDTLLWRKDLINEPVAYFYDSVTPAIYFSLNNKNLMLAVPELPRYNDYRNGSPRDLDIRLHHREGFAEVLGPKLRATIHDFLAYAELEPVWVDSPMPSSPEFVNPAIRLAFGNEQEPQGSEYTPLLVSAIPAERVVEQPEWAIEYLYNPTRQRLAELQATFDGPHGLIVEIPDKKFQGTYAIKRGEVITLGDTGYSLTIEEIGDYGMSFATRGYQGATDTRAVVKVSDGSRMFRRIAMFRYPERSQDFTPPPAGQPLPPGMGPMGQRTDPDPSIRLTYIDGSKPQYYLISTPGDDQLRALVRQPGNKPAFGVLAELKVPLGTDGGRELWFHITQRMTHAMQSLEPTVTPKANRQPKDEGTYIHALVPVDLELDIPASATTEGKRIETLTTWKKRVWLPHMRYPSYPDGVHNPVTVSVPTIGNVTLIFSRKSMPLPFALRLDDFEMQPYPGSQIPRDFVATLTITDLKAGRATPGETTVGYARLNNPFVYHGFKISQTGWDPGERSDPKLTATNELGKFTNQQRFSIMSVGNNVGIRFIALGAVLFALGIPLAFYGKPLILQYEKRRIQKQLAKDLQRLDTAAPTAKPQLGPPQKTQQKTTR